MDIECIENRPEFIWQTELSACVCACMRALPCRFLRIYTIDSYSNSFFYLFIFFHCFHMHVRLLVGWPADALMFMCWVCVKIDFQLNVEFIHLRLWLSAVLVKFQSKFTLFLHHWYIENRCSIPLTGRHFTVCHAAITIVFFLVSATTIKGTFLKFEKQQHLNWLRDCSILMKFTTLHLSIFYWCLFIHLFVFCLCSFYTLFSSMLQILGWLLLAMDRKQAPSQTI